MLEKTITFDRFVRGLIIVMGATLLLYVMNYLSSVLLPFFLGWLIAYILYPVVRFVQYKLHVPGRVLSIIVTLVFVIALITGIFYMIVPQIVSQFERLGELVNAYLHETTRIANFPEAIREWIGANSEDIQKMFKNREMGDTIRKITPQILMLITKTADTIFNVIASLVTLMYTFFILMDYEMLAQGFLKIFPRKTRPFWRELMRDVDRQLNSYIRGQGTVALCIGILFCIGFTLIGFPMAICMGILIGILSLIPYLHGLALIPIALLSLLEAADTGENFWIILASALGVFLVIQLITDMVLTPNIMGRAMNLNPAILLLALSVWGTLLGFIGLIIALPLTTLIMTYYQRYVTKDITIEKHVEESSDNEHKGIEDQKTDK